MCRGHSFFTTNEELLDRYAECPGSSEVIAVQTAYLDSLHAAPRYVPGAGVSNSCHRILARHLNVHMFANPSAVGAVVMTPRLSIQSSCAGTVCSILHIADHPSDGFVHVDVGASDDYLADVDLPPSSSGSDAESLADEAEDADESFASTRAQQNSQRYILCFIMRHLS